MAPSSGWRSPQFTQGSTRAIIWPFLAAIAVMLVVAIASMQVLSAVRAYVGGEGLYSKAQRDAVYYLSRFAASGAAPDYRRYEQAIRVPLGDRMARLALQQQPPDLPGARQGFLAGDNDPADVGSLIRMFITLQNVQPMKAAIDIWTRADAYTGELVAVADRLRSEKSAAAPRDAEIAAALRDLERINREVAPLEAQFSATLAEAARNLTATLMIVYAVASVGLALFGVSMTRGRLRDRDRYSAALLESEERYRTLIDHAPMMVAIIRSGCFLYANSRYLAAVGVKSVEDLIGKPIANHVASPVREVFLERAARRERGETVERSYETTACRVDGTEFPVMAFSDVIQLADGPAILGFFEDISERKRLEAEVASESARRQMFLRNASDGVHILDDGGRVVEASDSFCEMLGYTHSDVIGLQPVDWDARLSNGQGGIDFTDILERGISRFETIYRRKDGSTFEVELHVDTFTVDGHRFLFCAARDITELRRLERALLEVTSREQQKLGYDLHDELGQVLTGLAMFAGSLGREESAAGRPAAAGLSELEAMARRAIKTCRSIAHGLSPLTYQNGDLVQALEEMISLQEATATSGIHFALVEVAPLSIPLEVKEHLYRIAQEAVTNARRHAAAKNINVTMEVEPDTVRLEVQDDGIGIPPLARESDGMGLRIMRFRASMIGAALTIEPGVRAGTRVICTCTQGGVAEP
jgi:PAS domain S-box-containing protein